MSEHEDELMDLLRKIAHNSDAIGKALARQNEAVAMTCSLESTTPSPGLISKATAMDEAKRRSIRLKQPEESSQRFPSFLPSIRRLLERTGLIRAKSARSLDSKS